MNPTEANVDELLARRESIRRRLEQLSVPSTFSTSLSSPLHPSSAPSLSKRKKTIKLEDFVMGNSEVPIVSERTKDTHWSYLLKEMQWLSADFVAERKRHKALQKKLSHQVHTFFQTAESRRFKRLAQAEVQRRRLAHKISRDHVLKFWQKMERVIAFQQKATYEQARQTAMNQQLVKLVKITETYTTRLQQQQAQQQTDDRISAVGASITDIEKALQSSTKTRRSKHRIRDYAQFHTQETVLYGESTEELSGGSDDSTYSGTERDQELDDETTFLIAEREQPDVSEELRNLLLEKDMDIQQVLERLHAEGGDFEPENEHIHEPLIDPPKPKPPTAVGGDIIGNDDGEGDADDDMDASDVEDYEESAENSHDDDEVDNESEKGEERRPSRVRVNFAKTILGETNETDSSEEDQNNLEEEEEFVPEKGDDVDDETTMKAEEQLPRDMSYQQELELLKTESEIPIEQLRAMYQQSIQNSMSKMEEEEEEEEEEESEPYESAIEDDDGEDQISGAAQLLGSGIANDDQDEYVPDPQDTVDDETTMEAEEKLGRDMSYQEEIAMLQRENEMSVEELKAMVAQMAQDHYDSSHRKMSSSAVQEKGENDDVIEGKIEEDDTETSSKELSDGKRRREDDEDRLVPKKKPRHETMESISNAGLAAMDKLEVSAELARKTLASRPFLIPSWVKLREYQQIGLNWLLSLQTRRLNGILADGE
jgi:E1A-binding protein p400